MQEYVAVVCKNCGNIQCYKIEDYKNKKHLSCDSCGNGRVSNDMYSILKGMQNDFEILGVTTFKSEGLFDYYRDLVNKSVDKGFEVIKLKTDIE